ncbi:MAG TPA: hypothetical protein PLW95_06165 [bacterium]|nr:hypothetical protein [bacterium]
MLKKILTRLVFGLFLLCFAGNVLGLEMKKYIYTEDFEEKDPVKFWTSNGKYTINFKGLTDEKAFSGKQSFKLDITFEEGNFFYWCIPVKVPAEGELKFSGSILLGEETTGSAGLGVNVIFPPTWYSSCGSFDTYGTTKGEWKLIEGDLVKYGKETAEGVFKQHVWWVSGKDVGVYVDRVGIFLYGSSGKRVVVYVDDIKIEGEVPTEESYKQEIERRWSVVKTRFDEKKISDWEKILVESQQEISTFTSLTPEAEVIKKDVEEKINILKKEIEEIKKRGYINKPEVDEMNLSLTQLKDTIKTIKSISEREIKQRGCLIYIISPISGQKILPKDTFIPGNISDEIQLVATPGEYESGSFVIHSLSNITSLKVEVEDLKGEKGIISSENIDIKLVKCWYQSGTAWSSIIQEKNNRVLVPELLLNDDNLIKIDYENEKNYLKLNFPEGEKYIWISDPDEPEGNQAKILSINDYPVKDSSVLLPVNIPEKTNKQFWLTIKVPSDTKDGIYTGTIKLSDTKGEIGEIILRVKVLPFILASPKTYYDINEDFISSIYYRGVLHKDYPEGTISSEYKSKEQLKAELKDMYEHGITNPICYQGSDEKFLGEYLKIRQEVGIVNQILYSIISANCPPSAIKKIIEFVKEYGIEEVYFYGIDEASGEMLSAQRPAWEAIHGAGGKVFVAGYKGDNFALMGDIQDLFVRAGYPSREEAEKWHAVGHKIWCYAHPQAGPENPEVWRRNFGLVLWKSNYDGAATYAYQHSFGNIWNDFDHPTYRDHNFTYPTVNGVIDTIALEGYREGQDDIRYGTTLKIEIEKGKKSKNQKIKSIALEAEKYLEEIDVERGDLETIRLEMINYILKLTDRYEKQR